MRSAQRSFLLFLIAALILVPRNIFSCGPFFETATFAFPTHPDYPVKDYIAGKLGIIEPTYNRIFLVIAYRNLIGLPFQPAEVSKIDKLLTDEALYADAMAGFGMVESGDEEKQPIRPAQNWVNERSKVLGKPATHSEFDQNLDLENYQSFLNCPDSAFTHAIETLHDREQKWGTNSGDLKNWIEGQDIVFSHCSKRQGAMPPEVTTNNRLLKQDRDYQVAAALFYSGVPDQLIQAQQRFDAIGQDPTSPWRNWGPYLAARSLIRAATLKSADSADQKLLGDAEARLDKILADRDLAAVHQPSKQMLGFVEARLHPEERIRVIAQRLTNGTSPEPAQDLIDYRYLLDREIGSDPKSVARQDDLTDWIRTFQSGKDGKDHAFAKWKETRSLPWFTAAISAIEPDDPAAKDLLTAAAKLDARNPRALTVVYRRVAMLRQLHEDSSARTIIDADLAYLRDEVPISSRNLFWKERLSLARSFNEFLRFSPRQNAAIPWNQDSKAPLISGTPTTFYLDTDSMPVFNRALPLTLESAAASSTELPKSLRAQVAQATWTRALLLNRPEVAAKVSTDFDGQFPALTAFAKDFEKAGGEVERHRLMLFALLHNPGMRPFVEPNIPRATAMEKIDNFRDNWWCSDMGTRAENASSTPTYIPPEQAERKLVEPSAPFLNSAEKASGAREWNTLSKLGAAPNYLAAQVLEWAKAAPDDARIPEALHLVVRATRFGCNDDQTAAYSKKAFQLLHSKYPNNEWTKKTPYYY